MHYDQDALVIEMGAGYIRIHHVYSVVMMMGLVDSAAMMLNRILVTIG